MNFANKLKELRQKKGISQAKLAEDIYVSRSAIAKWENGLGIPSDESLELLAKYFNVDENDLLQNKENEQILTSKNQTIQDQKIVIGFAMGVGIGFLILAYLFIEPLREYVTMIAMACILIFLGIFNLQGNIGSIHWYNRRKVSKENQLPYCRLHGLGCITIGIAMILSAFFNAFEYVAISGFITLIGVIIGFGFILYAQFKYNKGIF